MNNLYSYCFFISDLKFACKSCDNIFPGSGYLRRHQKTCVINVGDKYGKKNVENDSTDESTSNNNVTDTTTKDGNNLISCEECSYTCNLKSKLKIHKRVHSGEKPFSCYVCDFTCSHSGNLKVHIRQHTGERPFACSECNYSSPQVNRLKTHMRVHTGEKPYSCDLCPFTCTLANNLKIHKRNHTNEKPFVCQLCAYSCKHMSNLKKHLTIHIAKAFTCGSCNFKSGNSVQYTMHMLKHKENSKLAKSAGISNIAANDFQNATAGEDDPLGDAEIVYKDDAQTMLENQQSLSINGGNLIKKYY